MVLYTPLYEGPINTRGKVARSVKKNFFFENPYFASGKIENFLLSRNFYDCCFLTQNPTFNRLKNLLKT